ncbi:cytochrome c3 family protein [Desulfovibrio mangrovi]|uniref:cytochrome c3 family protein n=1 Tax=Desulfovibrio mangrovi TaxID=2976983 RepID=UPI0022483C4D|nr:cytochrome c3 family protein [Desulfovibrio mangrovi]UZP66223.1 cytochrome c3 family protein [Desulfovibrio mangrovi]
MRFHVTLASIVILTVSVAAFAAAPAAKAPADPISITVPEGTALKKSIVSFPHAKHAGETCVTCHHTMEKNPEQLTCSSKGCHDLGNPTTKEEKKSMVYFRNAYHADVPASCNGCHKARKKEGKPAGPTDCKGCHR